MIAGCECLGVPGVVSEGAADVRPTVGGCSILLDQSVDTRVMVA